MFRKVALTSLAAVLVAGSLAAIPASAAAKASNGVACSKSGATTKSGGTTYRCTKNPLVKNAKLTWLSTQCLNLAASYNKSKAALPATKAQTDSLIAKFDLEIAELKVEADKAVTEIANFEAKISLIESALAKVKVDTATAVANRTKIMQYETGIRNFKTAIQQKGTYARSLIRTQTARTTAVSTYNNFIAEVDIALSMAKMVCGREN